MASLGVLSQENITARNFIVISHKSFYFLKKAYDRYGKSVRNQYLLCLYSFVKQKFGYNEQMIRVIRNICTEFCKDPSELSYIDLTLLIKSLTCIMKSKEKWAIDLLEDTTQYDVLEQLLHILNKCYEGYLQARSNAGIKEHLKQSGMIAK